MVFWFKVKNARIHHILLVILVCGCALRLTGLSRGESNLVCWGPLALDTFQNTERMVLTALLLAVVFSCAALWLTWILGRRYFSRSAACLGVAFLAFVPGAVQQAHFYLADGPFLLLSTATLYIILRALESDRRQLYLGSGVLIGLTACVRLSGILLGLPLAVGHLLRWRRDEKERRRFYLALSDGRIWLAVGSALLVAVILQPDAGRWHGCWR